MHETETVVSYVENQLSTYIQRQKQVEFLKSQMEKLSGLTESEAIETIYFRLPDFRIPPVQTNIPSDKTGVTACSYQSLMRRVNIGEKRELAQMVYLLQYELDYLQHCVDRLPDKQNRIIQALYFEGQTCIDAAYMFQISRQALLKHKRNAIIGIAGFYQKERKDINLTDWLSQSCHEVACKE